MNRPRGFTILAVILALVIWSPAVRVIAPFPAAGARAAVLLALDVLVVALMAVSIEALWRVRPWAARAAGALWAAMTLRSVVRIDYQAVPEMVAIEVAGVVLLAVILAIPLIYVRRRTEDIHGRPVRRPRAAPLRPFPGRVP